ncbi:hypothetical protein GCM10023107_01710 [Actinoplanes octamycinicus]
MRAIIEEGDETIKELVSLGVVFDKEPDDDDRFALGNEGGHSKRRVLHSKDTTGHAIASALIQKAKEHPNITFLEHRFAIDIITTGKLGVVQKIAFSAPTSSTNSPMKLKFSTLIELFSLLAAAAKCTSTQQIPTVQLVTD